MSTTQSLRAVIDFNNGERSDEDTQLQMLRAEQTRLRDGLSSILAAAEMLDANLENASVEGAETLSVRQQAGLVAGIRLAVEALQAISDAVEERS